MSSNIRAATYDGQWTLTLDAPNDCECNDENGIIIGNGKIAMMTHNGSPNMKKIITTSQLTYVNGLYQSNTIETFITDKIKFFDSVSVTNSNNFQSLNMNTAIFTNNYSSQAVNIETDIFAVQQLPFCTMQTVRMTPTANIAEMAFFHEVSPPPQMHKSTIEYNNNVIYNEAINSDKSLYILSGKGKVQNDIEVSFATMYLVEFSHINLGFNVNRVDLSTYNRFKFNNLVQGNTYKIHIVTSIITSTDYDSPLEEAKRILLKIANSGTSPQLIASKIRVGHTNAWQQLWKTDINITPKTGIALEETNKLNGLKKHLRYSIYTIMSCVRDNINVEINPLNLSIIDYDGTILYNGDIWLIPILLLIRPDVARALLEYRYKSIGTAQQLAAGYGYKGAKFPYHNDTLGYKNSLYWDTVGPMSAFNSGLVSINVWNYYRMTKDREWLCKNGYPILKNVADYYTSIIVKNENGSVDIPNIYSLNGSINASNNSFTNNIVKLALKYAIEASYELSYYVKEEWVYNYHNLLIRVEIDPVSCQPIIKANDNDITQGVYVIDDETLFIKYQEFIVDNGVKFDIIEPWFILIPYYSQIFFNPDYLRSFECILPNLLFYMPLIENNHPYNQGLIALLHGLYSQYNPNYVDDFSDSLDSFIESNIKGCWGHFGNDTVLSAILIFILLQGCMQMNIIGGIAESRFYYEDMKINFVTSANLPQTWKSISLITPQKKVCVTTNRLYYSGGNPCIC